MQIPSPSGRTAIAIAIAVAALLLAPALLAAEPAATPRVYFAWAVDARMQQYGQAERARLRSAIVAAVSREAARGAIPAGLTIVVRVQDIAPTRPTLKQQMDNPTVDPVRTKFLGGAALNGVLRDANERVVASVSYRYFPMVLSQGSVSLDPWADARLAIDQFAVKLAAACHDAAACRDLLPGRDSGAG